jgi:hypothetical protein
VGLRGCERIHGLRRTLSGQTKNGRKGHRTDDEILQDVSLFLPLQAAMLFIGLRTETAPHRRS